MTDTPAILPLTLKNVWFKSHAAGKSVPVPLIKDLSLRLEAGPRTIVLGPNGAGKSLLLRLCHGLLHPSEGTVIWSAPEPRRAQAMVFQRPVMLRRSVAANIDYALALHKVAKPHRPDIIAEVLKQTGLHKLAERPARVLSGGEQQRLAIARAWALKPQILFLDEPTASLDPSAAHQIEDLVNAMHAQGTKIVMTTHDMGQARRLADQVLFMHRGRLLEQTPADEYFAQPRTEPAQAFMKGELLWHDTGAAPKTPPKYPR